jgi:hypothetical protein
MDFTPKIYSNTTLGPIFSEALYANNTVSKNYVRVLDNIKYKQVVTTVSGDLVSQAYAVTPSVPGTAQIKFGDTEIEPIKFQIYDEFTMDTLRSTRFGLDMKSGAANMESNEFLSAVLGYAIPKAGNSIEKKFWDITTTNLASDASHIPVTNTTLTVANLVAELMKVYLAIPGEVIESGEAAIYVPKNVRQLAMAVNQDTTKYKNAFVVVGDSVQFMGIDLLFVPLAANTIMAGRKSDFILGTDLASDFGSFQVDRVQNNSDLMFMKLTYSLDSAVVLGSQKVIYAGGALLS